MGLFGFKYYYVDVYFENGKRAYTYKTWDGTIKVNDIVMVPARDEVKPAIVSRVRAYGRKDAPYPPEEIKNVIGRAGLKYRRLFRGVDMRVPFDISVKKVKTSSGHATVVTDKDERKRLKERYKDRSDIKMIETQPVSNAYKVISREGSRLFDLTGYWKKQAHMSGSVTYRCSRCGAGFAGREAFCPKCHSENKKIKYDPVWVDELAMFD